MYTILNRLQNVSVTSWCKGSASVPVSRTWVQISPRSFADWVPYFESGPELMPDFHSNNCFHLNMRRKDHYRQVQYSSWMQTEWLPGVVAHTYTNSNHWTNVSVTSWCKDSALDSSFKECEFNSHRGPGLVMFLKFLGEPFAAMIWSRQTSEFTISITVFNVTCAQRTIPVLPLQLMIMAADMPEVVAHTYIILIHWWKFCQCGLVRQGLRIGFQSLSCEFNSQRGRKVPGWPFYLARNLPMFWSRVDPDLGFMLEFLTSF